MSATTTVTPYVGQAQTTSVSYGYDVLGRLTTAAAGAAWAQTLTYDGYGNLAQKVGTGAAAAVGTADSRGLLNSVKNQIGAHDAAGNAVLPAGVYDFDNRLTEWGNERYGYDASNKRVVRTSVAVDSDKHVTFWVGSYKMGEYRYSWNGGWNLTAVSEWGMIGGRVVKPSDRLGSDISGGRTYLPYGEELNPSPGGRYKFATYWRDETGLDYADQRYYSPGSGRFLSADPYMASGGTAEPGSWNRYAYVGADPLNFVDPEGLIRQAPPSGVDPALVGFFMQTFLQGPRAKGGLPSGSREIDIDSPRAKLESSFSVAQNRISNDCANALSGGKLTDQQVRNKLGSVVVDWAPLRFSADVVLKPDGNSYSISYDVGFSPGNQTIQLSNDMRLRDPSAVPVGFGNGTLLTHNAVADLERLGGLSQGALSNVSYWSVFILHELGHVLGGLQDDAAGGSDANRRTVLEKCFK